MTKPCRSRPDEQSGSPPPIHTCTTRGGKTVGPSRCHNRQSHAHSIPRTGDKSPATCVKRSTQIRQSHSALHFLCLLFTFLSLSVVFRLTFFLACHSHLYFWIPTLLLVFSARAHTHTHSTPGGWVPHCALTSAVAFVHGGKCNHGLEIHGRKKDQRWLCAQVLPMLKLRSFPGIIRAVSWRWAAMQANGDRAPVLCDAQGACSAFSLFHLILTVFLRSVRPVTMYDFMNDSVREQGGGVRESVCEIILESLVYFAKQKKKRFLCETFFLLTFTCSLATCDNDDANQRSHKMVLLSRNKPLWATTYEEEAPHLLPCPLLCGQKQTPDPYGIAWTSQISHCRHTQATHTTTMTAAAASHESVPHLRATVFLLNTVHTCLTPVPRL